MPPAVAHSASCSAVTAISAPAISLLGSDGRQLQQQQRNVGRTLPLVEALEGLSALLLKAFRGLTCLVKTKSLGLRIHVLYAKARDALCCLMAV